MSLFATFTFFLQFCCHLPYVILKCIANVKCANKNVSNIVISGDLTGSDYNVMWQNNSKLILFLLSKCFLKIDLFKPVLKSDL